MGERISALGQEHMAEGSVTEREGISMGLVQSVGAVVVAVAVVTAVTLLTWHGSINGEAAVGIFGTIIGGGGVATVAHVATKTGAGVSYTAAESAKRKSD